MSNLLFSQLVTNILEHQEINICLSNMKFVQMKTERI